MKFISNLIVYGICLQLAVGSYPIQAQNAYAQEYNQQERESSGRSPASEKLNMSAQEVAENSQNYVKNFTEQCLDQKGNIRENVAFVHDREIGESEPRMYNCAAAAEVIQKVLIPGMNDVVEESNNLNKDPNCPDCGVGGKVDLGKEVVQQEACPLKTQNELAKEKCSFECNILATVGMQDKSCPKSSGVSGSCFKELGKGIAKAIWEILTFLPKLVIDGVKGGWNYLMGKSESASSKKAHALKGLSDEEIKLGKNNPEKLKMTLLQKVGKFLKELSLAIVGYPEYEAKAKCVNCTGKADLMCGVIGNTGGFLLSIFGNGIVFGAAKGVASKIGMKLLKISRGSSKLAKFTNITAKVILKPGKYVAKPFVAFGNVIVKGGSKISKTSSQWWSKFKNSGLYSKISSFKNTGLYKKAFSGNSKVIKNAKDFANKTGEVIKNGGKAVVKSQAVQIPKNITLKIGRGIGKGFKKMGEFEDRMFIKGVGLVNKDLQKVYLRADKIAKLRQLKSLDNIADVANQASAATDETLRGVDELKVVKDAADGRSVEEWSEIKKKVSDKLDIKTKHLDDVENAQAAEFSVDAAKQKTVMVDTPKGPREIDVPNASEVENIHVYQDGKMAIIKNKDGTFGLHNIEDGKTITKVSENKADYVDALLGKKSKDYVDLETASYNQVKSNLDINGTKYDEVVDASGNKNLKIETPEGCSPSSLNVGVEKAL